jgi:hypothetical protein
LGASGAKEEKFWLEAGAMGGLAMGDLGANGALDALAGWAVFIISKKLGLAAAGAGALKLDMMF